MASSGRIDELRKKFDENPRRYFAPLANEYRKVGDLQQAILICQEHLPQQPGHMSGHIVYGQALFESGRLDESRAIFETALTLDPENLIALRHLGDIARNSGNVEAAQGWYKRVLEADPRNEEIGQIMSAMAAAGASAPGAGTPTPSEVPVVPAAKVAPAPAASAPTAELSVEAIQQLAAARATQTARPSGARVMPAVPLDSLPTLVPGVPKVPGQTAAPQEAPPPPKPRRSSRSVTPLDWNDVQETPAAGTPSQSGKGTGYAGDSTDLLEIPDITLETKPVSPDEVHAAPTAAGGDLNLDLGGVFEADPLAITSHPAREAPEPAPLEGLETTSLASAAPMEHPEKEPDLLDVSLELPGSAQEPPSGEPPVAAAEPPAPESPPLEFVDVGEEAPSVTSQPAPPFVTSTMAELYVQQGHLESALEIYQQLAAQKPGDAEVAARVQALRREIEGSSMPPLSATVEQAPPAAPTQAEPPAPSPHAAVEIAPPAVHEGVAGPTIREFLQALVLGTADRLYATNGASHAAAGWGSIDTMFEGLPQSPADASAAEMLGLAFDDAVEVPLLFDSGAEPTSEAHAPEPGPGTGQRFSLDQFFSSEAGGVAGRRSNA